MRIAIGQIWQETNTFNPLPTTRPDFEPFGSLRGPELVAAMENTNELGGFIQSLRRWKPAPEIVGLVRLGAWPSGLATAETFDWLKREVLQSIEQACPIDALLLALHGSMCAEGHPDVEGELLTAIRGLVGDKLPIVATLDLHANVTRAMVDATNALVLFHTAPHVDVFETGVRGARVLQRILCYGARPVAAFAKLPCVLPAERANTEAASGVSVDLKRRLIALESEPKVLSAGIATVQPWLDIPDLGSAVIVTTDNDPALAQQACEQLAHELWERRREYLPEMHSIADAVALAQKQHSEGLVVLSDAADATTSGAPGDSVWILEELLRYEWSREVLVTLVSPEIVAQVEALGVSASWSGQIGGVRDHRFGKRIPFTGTIENVFDGKFVLNGHLGKNLAIDMGRCVVLRARAIRLIVTERSGPHFAPELFQAAGYDPFQAAVVVAKSPCGFRAVYASRAEAIYSVSAPGCAPTEFWKQPYQHIPRPLWPWDEIDRWRPTPEVFYSGKSVSAAALP
jgi:microcystin degradation protein MlrC